MSEVRSPAVAGRFYPGDPGQLRADVDALLGAAAERRQRRSNEAPGLDASGVVPSPKALIVPHAGYVYSGPIAASAFCLLARARGVRRVVLIGPSHFVPFAGVALPSARAFRTPLGEVALDDAEVRRAASLPQVVVSARAHADEHALEVELPFLQTALGAFEVVPLLTGEAEPEEVAEALGALWGGPETLIVVSSDLSHYLDYETASRRDEVTGASIVALRADELDRDSACGRLAIQGLLLASGRRGLVCSLLDLRNSGDTAGPRDRVVGYGAFALAVS